MVNLFASHDSLRQVIDEYAALGISGPYPVSNPNGVSGTERVEIITRDRNQPALVLSAVRLTRFTDYEFEPFSGRLLFRMPVPSLDERLNPVSIRVTYEVDAGGDKSWVGGGNVQMRFGKSLQVGGSWIEDGTPGSPYRLRSVNTTLRLGSSSTIVIEGGAVHRHDQHRHRRDALPQPRRVWTLRDLPRGSSGGTCRAGWWPAPLAPSRIRVSATRPRRWPAAGPRPAGARRFTITNGVSLIGEAIHSEDRLTDGRRDGGLLARGDEVAAAGVRTGRAARDRNRRARAGHERRLPAVRLQRRRPDSASDRRDTRIDPVTGQPIVEPGFGPQLSAGANAPATVAQPDVMTVRAKLTFLIGKRADIYGEGEQDVRSAERRVAAIGTQLKLSDRIKLYARHEFISSLDGPYALTEGQRSYNTVFGVASTLYEGRRRVQRVPPRRRHLRP